MNLYSINVPLSSGRSEKDKHRSKTLSKYMTYGHEQFAKEATERCLKTVDEETWEEML